MRKITHYGKNIYHSNILLLLKKYNNIRALQILPYLKRTVIKKDLLFIIHSGEEQMDTKKLATQSADKTGGEGGRNENAPFWKP